MRFDHLKMNTPSVLNDISYVKRQLGLRIASKRVIKNDEFPDLLQIEKLESLILFYRENSPSMKKIIDLITSWFQNDSTKEETLGQSWKNDFQNLFGNDISTNKIGTGAIYQLLTKLGLKTPQ